VSRTPGDSGDSGQSTVELALTIPLLMLLLLGAVQVAIIIRGQLTVVHAAREGARAAAVSAAAGAAATAAVRDAV
jgi:Flp pilus assembly protein TadG